MKKLSLISPILFALFFSLNLSANESYDSYNDILDNLNQQLTTKKEPETFVESMEKSTYSLQIGLTGEFAEIRNERKSLLGLSGELGIYNLYELPIKLGLHIASGSQTKIARYYAKTDINLYTYGLLSTKGSLAAGIGNYHRKNRSDRFTSFFLSPAVSFYYQIDKTIDLNIDLAYNFHAGNKVADEIQPSINITSYF